MRVQIVTLIAAAMLPMGAHAQAQATRAAASPVAVQAASEVRMQASTGPTVQAAAVGIRVAPAAAPAEATKAKSRRRSGINQDVALMIVGVSAMVAGSFIDGTGGTVFLVGGAAIGLWGLFNFLQ